MSEIPSVPQRIGTLTLALTHKLPRRGKKIKAGFVEPMRLLRSTELPDDDAWLKELKFDGYRALAIKTNGAVQLRSRNDNDFSVRYGVVTKALATLPDETVVDGEIVALD
jgi:bifunctional non-homologous end joining protein LigD